MDRPDARRHLVDVVPMLVALWIAWTVGSAFAGRWAHPYDLEWMEGGILGHAWQIVNGRPIYAEPTPQHVSFVYPPGYMALLAAMSAVFPLEYAPARVVSILATMAAAAAAGVGAWRQGGSRAAGIAAAALYLALYPASGGFYDLVRPDALGIALVAWALVIGLERHARAELAAAALLVAAFAVKHNLAAFGIPLLAAIWLRSGPAAARRFALASIVPALGFVAYLQWRSAGYFLKYIVVVPGSHGLNGPRAFPGTPTELVAPLLPGLVCAAVWLFLRAIPQVAPTALAMPLVLAGAMGALGPGAAPLQGPREGAAWVFHLGFAALAAIGGLLVVVPIDTAARGRVAREWLLGLVLAAVAFGLATLMRAHTGGFLNVHMPLYWVACFGLGVIAGRARRAMPGPAMRGVTAGAATAALLWAGVRLDLDRIVPNEADVVAGDRVVEALRTCNGPIFSPFAAWLPTRVGREPSAHLIGLWDIDYELGPFRRAIDGVYGEAARDAYWACVVEGTGSSMNFGVTVYYRFDRSFGNPPGAMAPKTGWRARPEALWVPRSAVPRATPSP